MSWVVEPPVMIGPVAFAAISEVKTVVRRHGRCISGVGEKRPVLLLQCTAGQIHGVDIDGNSYDEERIQQLHPEAVDQVRALLKDAN